MYGNAAVVAVLPGAAGLAAIDSGQTSFVGSEYGGADSLSAAASGMTTSEGDIVVDAGSDSNVRVISLGKTGNIARKDPAPSVIYAEGDAALPIYFPTPASLFGDVKRYIETRRALRKTGVSERTGFSSDDRRFLRANVGQVRWILRTIGDDYVAYFPKLRRVVELVNKHGREPFIEAAAMLRCAPEGKRDSLVYYSLKYVLPMLSGLVDEFGMEPILEIMRNDSSDKAEYPHSTTYVLFCFADLIGLIQRLGIEPFVRMSRELGTGKTEAVFSALKHYAYLCGSEGDFYKTCRILGKVYDGSSAPARSAIFNHHEDHFALVAMRSKVKTQDDLMEYGMEMARISHKPYGISVLSHGLCRFVDRIDDMRDLYVVGEMLSRHAVRYAPWMPYSSNAAQYLFMEGERHGVPLPDLDDAREGDEYLEWFGVRD